MNQLLEQLQKEFDEKFVGNDELTLADKQLAKDLKSFLTSSHKRIIEKFREMVESERKKGSWDYESNREMLSYNEALDDILSALIEQKYDK